MSGFVDRDIVFRGMNPEFFKSSFLISLFDELVEKGDTSRNYIDVILEKGIKIAISKSSSKCLKITTAEDIEVCAAILKYESAVTDNRNNSVLKND